MKNRNRPTPSFPAAPATIEAATETQDAVFHLGTEVLAAEATHHEAVDALEGDQTSGSTPDFAASAPEANLAQNAGRYESGAPSIVGHDDGVVTPSGDFQPLQSDDKGMVVDMAALEEEDAVLDARIDAELKKIVGSELVELPDGSVKVPVIVTQEMCVVIREWASGAGEDFAEYLQRIVEMGINAVVLGGSVAG